ncbi:MAG: hydrogenase maturation nickel metallochaperone HypA [Fidelibacterota bacterium]|nr:MAG: hydrogenase maturation nickel metallochaperone HypA [Candidatus Neomarinimicrobiota bacterium]
MHEMSIAAEILNIVERTVQENGADDVTDIFIEVGSLAGIMIPSLEFGLDIIKKNTSAREAAIHIEEIPGKGRCPNCELIFPMDFPIEPCPDCESSYLVMTSGDELRVREIEVERNI